MENLTKQQETGDSGAQALVASRVLTIVLAVFLLPALAADPPDRGALKANPRLASLQIEIWPEFDRPAALVILKGELAADIALPAAISLRTPASSGGPTAVASAAGPGARLFNVNYERKNADDFITVSFEIPQRLFHVEFYEPLATAAPQRSYTYVWPGDLAADRLSVVVQEPAGALGLSAQPNLDATAIGEDGLRYLSAELGALAAGKQLPIRIHYTKTDSRTSSEILQPQTPGRSSGKPAGWWAMILAGAVALLTGSGAAFLWWRQRGAAAGVQRKNSRLCPQCGTRRAPDDRFCAKCGTPLKND
ncbi:MAG: zinc-ribbon domain-containing protein [Burkholderiales bacterium]